MTTAKTVKSKDESMKDAVVDQEPAVLEDDGVAEAPADGAAADDPVRRGRGVPRWWPAAVAVVALLVLVAGSFSWWRADHDSDRALAQTRDAVLIAATSHIETLNSLDYQHVDAGLKAWGAVTTGTLHDQLSQVTADQRTLLEDQKKISTGKVVDAAVFSLSDDTATVLASVEVTVRDGLDKTAAPTVKRNRFKADLVDVHGRWLVESLQQVAVDIS